MKKNTLARIVAAAVGASALLMPGIAQAALQDRDLDGDSVVDAFYDTDLDITWLRNADVNGQMAWASAVSWADNFSFAGYDDWRLPTTVQPDPGCSIQSGDNNSGGFNCTTGEMGHLWYVELGNTAGVLRSNTGNFQNLRTGDYWYGTEGPFTSYAHIFGPANGFKHHDQQTFALYAMAVRPGDVPAVPESQTYALMPAGLAALMLVRRRRPR